MKHLLILLIVSLSIVQTSNNVLFAQQKRQSQYTLLKRGEASPYDSAVAVEISQYRLESIKLSKADSIVQNFVEYVRSTNELVMALKAENSALVSAIQLQEDFILKSKANQEEIKLLIQDLKDIEPVKDKFYEKPLVVAITSIALTLLLVR